LSTTKRKSIFVQPSSGPTSSSPTPTSNSSASVSAGGSAVSSTLEEPSLVPASIMDVAPDVLLSVADPAPPLAKGSGPASAVHPRLITTIVRQAVRFTPAPPL
jgi:hypothetical protein